MQVQYTFTFCQESQLIWSSQLILNWLHKALETGDDAWVQSLAKWASLPNGGQSLIEEIYGLKTYAV